MQLTIKYLDKEKLIQGKYRWSKVIFTVIILIIINVRDVYGNDPIKQSLGIGLGFSKAIGKDISKIYDYGLDAKINYRFVTLDNTLGLNPNVAFQYFSNNLGNNLYERIIFISCGLDVHYYFNFGENNKWKLFPIIGLNYGITKDQYKVEDKDLNVNETYDLITQSGFFIHTGIGICISNFSFEIVYNPFNTYVEPSDKSRDDFDKQGFILKNTSLSLNTMRFFVNYYF